MPGTAGADFLAPNFNSIDKQTQVFAARGLRWITQLIGNQLAEPRYHVWRDLAPAVVQLPLGHLNINRKRSLLRGDVAELGLNLGIVGGDAAKPNQLDDVSALSFKQRHASSQLLQLLASLTLGMLAVVDERLEQRMQTGRLEYTRGDGVDDDSV